MRRCRRAAPQAVWGLPFYTPLYCITKLISIGFYASLMGATRYLARSPCPRPALEKL